MDSLYKKVDNLVSKELCDVLAGSMLICEHQCPFEQPEGNDNRLGKWNDTQVLGAFSIHGYPALDSLMCYLRPKIEEVTGKKLFPCYSYARVYRNGNYMVKHIDRPACEYSVTITLKSDKTPYPIYMDGTPIVIEQGSGVVYQGTKIPHWRKIFEGNEHIQTFLHYVDAEGEYAGEKYDQKQRDEGLELIDPFC